GLLQFNFRKLINSAPTTLGTWFSNTFPGGSPAVNTWHKMKVTAIGNTFRCYWDGFELTNGSPIVDSSIPTGWVGVYNFRFDLGNITFYVDDLILDDLGVTPTARTTWGALKSRYVKEGHRGQGRGGAGPPGLAPSSFPVCQLAPTSSHRPTGLKASCERHQRGQFGHGMYVSTGSGTS